jgi:hypothetical protein
MEDFHFIEKLPIDPSRWLKLPPTTFIMIGLPGIVLDNLSRGWRRGIIMFWEKQENGGSILSIPVGCQNIAEK